MHGPVIVPIVGLPGLRTVAAQMVETVAVLVHVFTGNRLTGKGDDETEEKP